MLVVLSLLAGALGACVITSGTERKTFSYDEVYECLKEETFNPSYGLETYKCVRDLVRDSAFYDDYKNPPAPFEYLKMDQVKHLDNEVGYDEGTDTFTRDYTSAYDFHMKLMDSFKDFHDAHQTYKPNVLSAQFKDFTYTTPYMPAFKSMDSSYRNIANMETFLMPVLDIIEEEASSAIDAYTDYYTAMQASLSGEYCSPDKLANLMGATVNELSFLFRNGNESDPLSPIDFYKTWAREFSDYSKDIGAGIFHVVNKEIKYGELILGLPPIKAIKYKLTKANENAEVCTVPYVFYNKKNFPLANWTESMRESIYEEELLINRAEVALLDFKSSSLTGNRHTAVLELPTMELERDIQDEIKHHIRELNKRSKIERFIFDVRSNDGGKPDFAGYLTSLLNKKISQPHSRHLRMKVNDYNENNLINLDSKGVNNIDMTEGSDVIDHRSTMKVEDMFKYYEELEFTDATTDTPSTFRSKYTRIFNRAHDDILVGDDMGYTSKDNMYSQILDLDQPDVVIITDGTCGSACATFLWDAYENHAARIYNVGVIQVSSQETITASAASFAGGQKNAQKCYYNGAQIDVGYMSMKEYSRVGGSTPLEFKYLPSDFSIPRYYAQNYIKDYHSDDYYSLLYAMFNTDSFKEHGWEGDARHETYQQTNGGDSVTLKCDTTAQTAADTENRVYGCKWNSTDNDYTGEVVPMYCKLGYYEDLLHKDCLPIPNYEAERDEAQAQAATLQTELTKAEESVKQSQEEVKKLTDDVGSLTTQLETTTADLDSANSERDTFMIVMIIALVLLVVAILVIVLAILGVLQLGCKRHGSSMYDSGAIQAVA